MPSPYEIIKDIRKGIPYQLEKIKQDGTSKTIGEICIYYSQANECFQKGRWYYELKTIQLEGNPQKLFEDDVKKIIKEHQKK